MDKVDEDEDEAVFGEVRNNVAAAATSDGSANLEVAIKKDYISPEEMDVLKVTLSSYVMMREPNATDDATAVAASFARATDMHHVTKTNDRAAREEVSEHVLRYLKVCFCYTICCLYIDALIETGSPFAEFLALNKTVC